MQFDRLKRREFISLLGGAAATWPLAARAQQPDRIRRIGVLMNVAVDDPEAQPRVTAFVQALGQLGWIEGRNMRIDYRWARGDLAETRRHAEELTARTPDAIMASGQVSLETLLKVTRTVPIVFALVPDPVGAGYVDTLAHPGGNATGFLSFEYSISGKMAGVAQRDRAKRQASSSSSRSRLRGWDRTIRCNPIGGTFHWNGSECD
jgi:putative tryptophan/tyrosine transport system substrate-binding protein